MKSIHDHDVIRKRGADLNPEDQAHVLRAYVHRFTGEHRPKWTEHTKTPLQFASDQEWLAHTEFAVRRDGRLDRRVRECYSTPTWPNNPELRKPHANTN